MGSIRTRPRGDAPGPTPGAGLTATLSVGLLLLLLAASVASAGAAWSSDPPSWSNGSVLCQFNATSPSVAVSAVALPGTGLDLGLAQIAELHSNGAPVAYANLSGIAWTVENASTDDVYELAYSASVPVVPVGSSTPVGDAEIGLNVSVPAYGSENDSWRVSAGLAIVVWPWQGTNEALTVEFAVAPALGAAEHLAPPSSGPGLVAGEANATGTPLQWIVANSSAADRTPSGTPGTLNATPGVHLTSPSQATLEVALGPTPGHPGSIAYGLSIGIGRPSTATVAGIPLADLLATALGGVAVCAVLSAALREVRRRPSPLVYVEEEER